MQRLEGETRELLTPALHPMFSVLLGAQRCSIHIPCMTGDTVIKLDFTLKREKRNRCEEIEEEEGYI